MRLGIFGGSFDPVHTGHLVLAESCRVQANLDQIWFVPCHQQPHKEEGPIATARQRVEMIEFAIAGHDAFAVSKIELERGEVSYTIDTLREVKQLQPDAELFFLMGDDSLESFASWKEPGEICNLACPLVVNRPGAGEVDLSPLMQFVDDERFELFKTLVIQSPRIEISSTDLRERFSQGVSARYLTPRSVEKFIDTQKLYQRD